MKYFWITLSLLMALSIGCNSGTSSDDQATDDGGSANVTSDGQTDATSSDAIVNLPPMDQTELTSTDNVGDESADQAQADGQSEEESADAIRQDINARLTEALRARDLPAALAVIEEGTRKLPSDADLSAALIALRIQNDLRLAAEEEKDVAVASIKETEEMINQRPDGAPELPDRLWQLFHISQARRHAHAGDVEKSLAALSQAGQRGFDQFSAVADDPFFESLKDKGDFQAGLDELTQKAIELKQKAIELMLAEFESFDFDFELQDLEGKPIKLADYVGKVVIVDIWGTWCPPCKAEIPHFIQLQDAYKDDLAIVGITYERFDGEERAMAGVYENEENRAEVVQRVVNFAKEQGINYAVALGDQATQQMIPDLSGFPTTLFIDREGKVRLKVVGYHPYEQLDGYVAALLKEGGEKQPAE